MTLCETCEGLHNQSIAAYRTNRSNAPRIDTLISISEEELRSIRNDNMSESKNLSANKKRLHNRRNELATADQGWAFLWIESQRRRSINAERSQLDDEIRVDEERLLKLRKIRREVDKLIEEIGA